MRRLLWILPLMVLLLSTGGLLAQDSASPLQLVESDPVTGFELSPDTAITLFFNHALDCDSVAGALDFSPEVAGDWACAEREVQFTPSEGYPAGEVQLTISTDLLAAEGQALAEALSLNFRTRGDLQVTEVLPADGGLEIATDATITVIFNRPVVPLGADAADLPNPLRFSPEVDGTGEWLNTAIYVFRAAPALSGGTDYTVTVAEGLTAADGASLQQPFHWSFSTDAPEIVETYPLEKDTGVLLDSAVEIHFNQPMDRASVEANFTLQADEDDSAPVAGSFEWDESGTQARFIPAENLQLDTLYIASLNADAVHGENGGASLSGLNEWEFITVPLPAIVGSTPADGTENAEIYGNIILHFAGPMNQNSLEDKIRIEPEPCQSPTGYYFHWDYSYNVAFPVEPSTDYTVTVLAGAEDMYGNVIEEDTVIRFTTAAAPSSITLQVTGPVGFYNAYNDETRLFLTHRNIDQLDFNLYAVDLPGFISAVMENTWNPARAYPTQADTLVNTWSVDSESPLNESWYEMVTLTEAENADEALSPGMYYLEVADADNRDNSLTQHILAVSTANLVVKSSSGEVFVWATDVNTGAPIANAPIAIYAQDQEGIIAEGTTDADGTLTLEVPWTPNTYTTRVALLNDETHFGIGVTEWTDGINAYQFGVDQSYSSSQYSGYVYTDRPVYRPGQPVYFRGIVRQRDDMDYRLVDRASATIAIMDSNGETIYSEDLPLSAYGTFSGQFDLADDAGLGYYLLSIQPFESDQDPYAEPVGMISFDVAEYRTPEFIVSASTDRDAVVQNESIQLLVDSQYFFGGAVIDSEVNYSVRSEYSFFDYQGPGGYSFVDYNDDDMSTLYGGFSQEIASGTGTTDAEGRFMVEIPATLKDSTQSLHYTLEATVQEASGQVVAGRTTVTVHQGLVYVGVKPASYVSTVDEAVQLDLIMVDWDSQPVSGQTVNVEIVERRWSNVQEEDESGRTIWQWEVEELPVTEGSVTLDADGEGVFSFTPENGGIFKAIVRTQDEAGNTVQAATSIWVASSDYVSWRQQNSNRIDLVSNQSDYAIGDTAEILITSPFQGSSEALITVERGDVLQTERVTLDSNSYVYTLPITEDFAPNVFVSVMLVKGVDENNPVAAFRMGLVQLNVDNSRKVITLNATPDREQAGPRETVTYTLTAQDYTGAPVEAELGVSLTDLAALSISQPNSQPILSYFYGQQGLGVVTSTGLTINTDQLTQTTLDTIKGGGGGGLESGIFDIREDFVDTAFWDAHIVTDENGEATVEITLPDNLTTWRLDVRAVTNDENDVLLVGQNTFDLLSTKPLLIRPVTPRFAVVGDEITLRAVVNNNTDEALETVVSLEGSGFTGATDSQTVSIPASGNAVVEWAITVDDVDALDLTFFANANEGDYTDASRPPMGQGDERLLPVYRYTVAQTVGTAGVLTDAATRTETIVLPRSLDVTAGALQVNLDPSLAASTVDALNYLRQYPYQSTETTISRLLANVASLRALNELPTENAELHDVLTQGINLALQELFARQKVDGGWGWYIQDESNPVVSAYALIALVDAQAQGFPVADSVIQQAQAYLRTSFITPGPDLESWELNRYSLTLYALAHSGVPEIGRSATLYEHRARLDYYAQALLAQNLHIISPEAPERVNTILSDLFNAAIVSATGTHWEEDRADFRNWNTDTRSTAIILRTLIQLQPESELIPNGVRWLMVSRQADAWETTQETAWAVLALTDWMLVTGELAPAYDYQVTLNTLELTAQSAEADNADESVTLDVAVADLLQDEANQLTIERDGGPGSLYYTAHLQTAIPVTEVEAVNRGIILQRHYTLPGDDTPITQARVGDLVAVRLSIIAPNDLHFVVIDDPIPAGAEGVDPNLETSEQIGTQPGLENTDPLSFGWGWWWFSNIEFRDEKVVLNSTYLPAGTYEYVYYIRAGLPGTYNVMPPQGHEAYFPEVSGNGAGSRFTILPEAD